MKLNLFGRRGKPEDPEFKNSADNPFHQNWEGQPAWSEQNPDGDMLLDGMIAHFCYNSTCSPRIKGNKRYPVEYLVENLPSITTVANMYTQLIVGGGLICPTNKQANDKLQSWLKQKPLTSMTNQAIINDAIQKSVVYGYTGLRDLGNGEGVIPVHPGYFRIWKIPKLMNGKPIPGVSEEFLYEVSTSKGNVEKKSTIQKITYNGHTYSLSDVIREQLWKIGPDGSFYFDDGAKGAAAKNVYVPKKNFCHLRHGLDGDYGESILNRDRLRLGMMVDLLINMNDEINNDGNDYLMWLKESNVVGNSITSLMSNMSASQSTMGAMDSKATNTVVQKNLESANALALKMKRSQKTRIMTIRKDIIDSVERLDGTARLIDYYPFLADATTIIANAFGLHPILAGSTSSGWNTSMSSVIQFTLEKIIVPFQRMYSSQIEAFIRQAAGINAPIQFKEYDLSDKETISLIEEAVSRTKLNLAKEQEVLNNIKIATKLAKKESTNNGKQEQPTKDSEK